MCGFHQWIIFLTVGWWSWKQLEMTFTLPNLMESNLCFFWFIVLCFTSWNCASALLILTQILKEHPLPVSSTSYIFCLKKGHIAWQTKGHMTGGLGGNNTSLLLGRCILQWLKWTPNVQRPPVLVAVVLVLTPVSTDLCRFLSPLCLIKATVATKTLKSRQNHHLAIPTL